MTTSAPAAHAQTQTEAMLIGGDWTGASSGRTLPVENPAHRGSVLAHVPMADAVDVDRAVAAAVNASSRWRAADWKERSRALLRIADALEAQLEDVARLLASETGSAIRTQARPEVGTAVDILRYFGGLASEVKGESIPLGEDMLSYTRREPWGVVGAIVPWNAPVSLAVLKIAPALAAGNVMILKPSAQAPLSVLAVARICAEFLPPGVLNVITGTGTQAGALLAADRRVAKLSFTGDTSTGKLLMHEAAERVMPVTLELGGKSPSVVFPDADDERTVNGVIAAMRFTRQGQSCTAGSRLLLHESVHDSFLDRLAGMLAELVVGDPLDERTDIGAMASGHQLAKVGQYVQEALAQEGARLVTGGVPPEDGPLAEGYFAVPTVLAGVQPHWRVAREEVFGPVLVAIPWRSESEAVQLANDTHYGLAAYVFSRDVARAVTMAHQIDAGFIQVNQGRGGMPGQSFGGMKQSGLGREYSLAGMLEGYTQIKNVTICLR